MKKVIACCLAFSGLFSLAGCGRTGTEEPVLPERTPAPYELAAAAYPSMAPYPDETLYIDNKGAPDDEGYSKASEAWWDAQRAQRAQGEGNAEALRGFLQRSMSQFLTGEESENRVYSPLNVYMALSMLAEVTDGTSRQQLLTLLGAESVEALRGRAKAVWNANYCNDGATASVLASSLWLRQDMDYVPETLTRLQENYYASAFQGEMGSEELNQALRDWLSEQTGGLLQEQAADLSLKSETVLALATTIYFRAKWTQEFSESLTAPAVFHSETGDVTCDFLRRSASGTYYWGSSFGAVALPLESGGEMWLLLPDEGVTPEELLAQEETMDFLLDAQARENNKYLVVNLAVPKFDVAAETDLCGGLRALGVNDVFDAGLSDFSPLTTVTDGIALTQAQHAARVSIDEKGCTAAAYTVMAAAGSAMPPEEQVDFILDRPFLFVITGTDGLPLFAGVVHTPV